MLGAMQKGEEPTEGTLPYMFDHEQSFREEVKKVESQLAKKHKK
jgi:hypothetical protein